MTTNESSDDSCGHGCVFGRPAGGGARVAGEDAMSSLPVEIETFGQAVHYLREKKRITLRALANMVGLSAPFLSDVEHDRRMPTDVARLAAALDVSADTLAAFDGRQAARWLTNNPGVVRLLENLRRERVPSGRDFDALVKRVARLEAQLARRA